jgi:hypothetical protein
MKRTALKRKTPLRAKTPLKRTRIRHKAKRHINITPEVIAAVNQRADTSVGVGRCEVCGQLPDVFPFKCEMAEPKKKMGGTVRQFTADEVIRKCPRCHKNTDHGERLVKSEPQWTQH